MIDLTLLPPDYRLELIKLGKRFASQDVLAQAAQTRMHYKRTEGILQDYGYDDSDVEELDWLCNELEREVEVRDSKQTNRRLTRAEITAIEKDARLTRRLGRTALMSARKRLLKKGALEPVRQIDAVLTQTQHANPDSDLLRRHLTLIASVLEDSVICGACRSIQKKVKPRLPTALQGLSDAEANRPRRQGTPYTSDRIDLLDGLLIDNVRSARQAAKDATDELGKPHILKGFLLIELYGKPRTPKSEEQELEAFEDSEEEDDETVDE